MRNALLWGTAVIFLLTALYTVSVRREVYSLAGQIGSLRTDRLEQTRTRDNLRIRRARLEAPAALRLRARELGIKRASGEARR